MKGWLMTGVLLLIAAAAFEPQSDSPWLSGAAAAALFPRSYMALTVNPAAIGLLGEPAVSVSASRPFGFTELDRTAVAGGTCWERSAAAVYGAVSGRNGYLESTFTGTGAVTLRRNIIAGLSCSWHRLAIEGYGASGALSADAGIIARPVDGVFLGASARGLFSTSVAQHGSGAVPRTISAAAGVCPVKGISISAAGAIHQYAGSEYSAVTSVEPFPGVCLSVSLLTPPVRMGFTLQVSVQATSLQYGYSTHPVLPSGHAAGLTYGTAGFTPEPVSSGTDDAAAPAGFPVNLNTATEEQLQQVPGIGPSTAAVITGFRQQHGPFESVDRLIDVPGIGPATLESLKPYLTI